MKKRFLHLFSLMLAVLMLIPCVGSAEEAVVDNGVMREGLTALEATRLMGNGINLGNTLEACDNNYVVAVNLGT